MSAQLAELARCAKSDVESLDCKFVDPFPKEVQTDCSICLHILKEPYLVSCCGYRFCKACLTPSILSCPLCKTYGFVKVPDKQLERLLTQRDVYCILCKNGCSWTGELGKLSSHLEFDNISSKSACEYLPVQCTFCNNYFRRLDLQTHQETCELRPSICTYCSYKCPYKDLCKHWEVCPNFPRICKHKCSDKHFTQEEMEAHLANDCPLETISCEYQFAGCGMQFLRKDLEEHMEEKWKVHLRQVTAKCQEFQNEKENSPGALQNLKTENEKMTKQIAEMTLLIQQLVAENERLKLGEERKQEILNLTVTNLPPKVNKHHLKCVFGQYGTVEDIKLNKPHNAIITYSEQFEFEEALEASSAKGINLLKHRLSLQANYST